MASELSGLLTIDDYGGPKVSLFLSSICILSNFPILLINPLDRPWDSSAALLEEEDNLKLRTVLVQRENIREGRADDDYKGRNEWKFSFTDESVLPAFAPPNLKRKAACESRRGVHCDWGPHMVKGTENVA